MVLIENGKMKGNAITHSPDGSGFYTCTILPVPAVHSGVLMEKGTCGTGYRPAELTSNTNLKIAYILYRRASLPVPFSVVRARYRDQRFLRVRREYVQLTKKSLLMSDPHVHFIRRL